MTAFVIPMMVAASTFADSPEGAEVARHRCRTVEHLRLSNTIGHAALHTDLKNLAHSCGDEGWDGHDACAIDAGAIRYAQRLLDAIPAASKGVQLSIGAEADGQVTVEWHKSPCWTLSVSVSSTGELHYAALLGSSSAYGTEPFDLTVGLPDAIRRLIRRIEAA